MRDPATLQPKWPLAQLQEQPSVLQYLLTLFIFNTELLKKKRREELKKKKKRKLKDNLKLLLLYFLSKFKKMK